MESEQWRLSTYSTWRLHPLKMGMHLNMAAAAEGAGHSAGTTAGSPSRGPVGSRPESGSWPLSGGGRARTGSGSRARSAGHACVGAAGEVVARDSGVSGGGVEVVPDAAGVALVEVEVEVPVPVECRLLVGPASVSLSFLLFFSVSFLLFFSLFSLFSLAAVGVGVGVGTGSGRAAQSGLLAATSAAQAAAFPGRHPGAAAAPRSPHSAAPPTGSEGRGRGWKATPPGVGYRKESDILGKFFTSQDKNFNAFRLLLSPALTRSATMRAKTPKEVDFIFFATRKKN